MGFSFTEPFGDDLEEIYEDFVNQFRELIQEIDLILTYVRENIDLTTNDELLHTIQTIETYREILVPGCEEFFKENKENLLFKSHGKTFLDYIYEMPIIFNSSEQEINLNSLKTIQFYIKDLTTAFIAISGLTAEGYKTISLIEELEEQVVKAKKNVENLDSAKLALESNETDKIFVGLSEKYEDEYELNNKYFTYSLIATACCTILSIAYTFNTPIDQINWPVFISVKILIVAVGITLCTLFLRRSAHAKKLHEKAYQTHVEINAYPIFIKSLETKDQQEITKELALRYFGNDIDQTQNDKIGDLMQDQLSAGTELIRASAELVKVKSESDGNK